MKKLKLRGFERHQKTTQIFAHFRNILNLCPNSDSIKLNNFKT
jgi:hypothetical protein